MAERFEFKVNRWIAVAAAIEAVAVIVAMAFKADLVSDSAVRMLVVILGCCAAAAGIWWLFKRGFDRELYKWVACSVSALATLFDVAIDMDRQSRCYSAFGCNYGPNFFFAGVCIVLIIWQLILWGVEFDRNNPDSGHK